MKLKMVVVDLEMSAKTKRWALRACIPAALLVGALAYAGGLTTWSSGQTLTAAALNGNFQNLQNQISAGAAWSVNGNVAQSSVTGPYAINAATPNPEAELQVGGQQAVSGDGTITSSGTTVTGLGSAFTTQLNAGDIIGVGSQEVEVATVTSDTSLTTVAALNPAANVSAYTINYPILEATTSAGKVGLYLNAAGALGIGTANPAVPLDVRGYAHFSGMVAPPIVAQGAYLSWNTTGGAGETDLINQEGLGSGGFFSYNYNGAGTASLLSSLVPSGVTGPSASGSLNVGSLTTAHDATIGGTLGVAGYGSFTGSTMPSTSAQGAYLNWNASGGTGETDLVNQRGEGTGGFYYYDETTTGVSNLLAIIIPNLKSVTQPPTTSGFLSVGSLTAVNLRSTSNSNIDGNLTVTGTVTATSVTQTSDARLKHDVVQLQDSLKKLQALRGVSYVLNSDASGQQQIGVIAQEVEAQFPEVVSTGADGYKAVAYDRLVAPLIESVKEEQEEIEDLRLENQALRKQLAQGASRDLENRLARLEKMVGAQEKTSGRK